MLCLLLFTVGLSCIRLGHSQNFGPNFCLLSRLDVIPCLRVFPNTTEPGPNEYSIYQTIFALGPAGLPVCIVNPPSGDFNPIQNLQSIGSNDQVKYLYSPGYLGGVPYGNQLLVTYNVQCPSHHIPFISLLYADIEPTSCLDRCVDYILVDMQDYGVLEACGNETGQLQSQLELGNFMVNFRTSPTIQHSGFLAKVVCFLQELSPPADCLVADFNTIQFAPTFSEGSVYFSEEQIHIAQSFQNACNPVLKAEAIAIIESVRNRVCPQCHLNAECYNSVTCTCREGFYGNGHFCADYDECSSGLNNCSDDADCINNQGSFMCSCHKSFNGNGITCLSTEQGNSSCNVSDPNCVCFENDCKCKVGYELIQNDGMTSIICKDIDECLHDPCMDIQFCKNTDGSYVCTCTSGYVYNIINGTCDDFDECRFEFSDCDKNAKCTNLNGSFDCTCNAGFTGNGKSCYSTDELCEDALDCQQTCIGSADYFGCTCWPGYILALDQKSCQDINECLLSYDNCDENASCNNTEGGFSCTCNPGYYGNGQFCVDIDECKAGEYQCDVNAKCINTVGNYSCQCQPPYNGDGFTCSRGPVIQRDQRIDRPNHHLYYPIGVDFCLEESFDSYHFTINCPLQSPVFPVAEFQFSITQTYSGINVPISNYTVTNISEIAQSLSVIDSSILTGGAVTVYCGVSNSNGNDSAETLISVCGPMECQDGVTNNCTQYCTRNISENGTVYLCSCDEGFIFINGQCEKENECLRVPSVCPEFSKCFTDTKFNDLYVCLCERGYEMDENNHCIDLNECENGTSSCQQVCYNNNGSFTCGCYDGFYLDTDLESCININECENEMNNCSSDHMLCFDTDGSFACECEQGYRINIDLCEDIDECTQQLLNNCSYKCVNKKGSYDCTCRVGFSLQNDGKTCEVSTELIAGSTFGALLLGAVFIMLVVVCIKCLSHRYNTHRYAVKTKGLIVTKEMETIDKVPAVSQRRDKSFTVQSSYKLNIPEHLIIHAANIELCEAIGQGEFGLVYKGHIMKESIHGKIAKDVVAIKTLKGFYDHVMVRDMLQECKKMFNLEHPNVLSLSGVCLDGGTAPYIVMPFMANGSLLAYLKKHRKELIVSQGDEQECSEVLKRLVDMCIQVAKGMNYLAQEGVVHRDLAARNCMISFNFVIKVADFGLAVNLGAKQYFRQDKDAMIKLPLRWLAPECIHDFMFSEKSDVWAYGVTCWEIFSGGMLPYAGISAADLPDEIQKGKYLTKPNNAACNDEMYSFIKDCWALDSEIRPTFASLVTRLSSFLESMASYVVLNNSGSQNYSSVGIISSDNVQKNRSPAEKYEVTDINESSM